jgi:hypothetical protein
LAIRLEGKKLLRSFKLGEWRGNLGRVGFSNPGLDKDGDVGKVFEQESSVDAKGSGGRSLDGCAIAKHADDADEGGDMNAEYTVSVFVFGLGY